MTDTGWKMPQTVAQDNSDNINPGKEYPFKNLNNLKKDDNSYTDISPWATSGIDSTHKSPFLYAYNYGFNIPSNATVNKIILFVKIQQLTHPLPKYDPKGKYRYSISKFHSLKLKVGSSVLGAGNGTNFAGKSANVMLPYKRWSTEAETTFSGTPGEWGLTGTDIISIINSGNFGVVLQTVGTVYQGWCNPGVAVMKMRIEYTVPQLTVNNNSSSTIAKSEFTRLSVSVGGVEVSFTNNVSAVLGTLVYDDYTNPLIVSFNFYHKGLAGETPVMVFESDSLVMGSNRNAYAGGKTCTGRYTMSSLHCGTDTVAKKYTSYLAVFPGILLGEQRIKYKWNNVVYTLRFKVDTGGLSDTDKARFMNMFQKCVVKNCLFYNNHALGYGGANCITSEFYLGSGNVFGRGANVNRADNKYGENGGRACPDTCLLGACKTGKDGG